MKQLPQRSRPEIFVARKSGQRYQSSQCQRYKPVSGSKAGGKAGGSNGAGGNDGAGGRDLGAQWGQRAMALAASMALAAKLAASMALAAWRQSGGIATLFWRPAGGPPCTLGGLWRPGHVLAALAAFWRPPWQPWRPLAARAGGPWRPPGGPSNIDWGQFVERLWSRGTTLKLQLRPK
eukprot:gene15791-biopygen5856